MQPRVLGQRRAVNRRVEFAGNQHGRNVLIGACPDNARRVASFRDVTVLEGHPLHAAEIDAVIILQNASEPHAGGLTIRTDADAPTGKIVRRELVPRSALKSMVPC